MLKAVTHVDEAIAGFSGAFVWLKDRMAGKPLTPGCQKVAVSRQSILAGSSVLIEAIWDLYLAYLGVPVGLDAAKYQQATDNGAGVLASAVQSGHTIMATPAVIL